MTFLCLRPNFYCEIDVNLTPRAYKWKGPLGSIWLHLYSLQTQKGLFGSTQSFSWGPPGTPSSTPGGPRGKKKVGNHCSPKVHNGEKRLSTPPCGEPGQRPVDSNIVKTADLQAQACRSAVFTSPPHPPLYYLTI